MTQQPSLTHPVFARAKALLDVAEQQQRRPFGWVVHPSVYDELVAASGTDPALRYLHLMRYRLFFSDAVPHGTMELIFDEPV